MVVTFAMMLGVGILVAIFRSEFEAWMPWVAERLKRAALKPLDGSLRERLDEEWAAHLAETPGFIGKICAAIGFNWASRKISIRIHVYRWGYGLSTKMLTVITTSSRIILDSVDTIKPWHLPTRLKEYLAFHVAMVGFNLVFVATSFATWRACLILDPEAKRKYEDGHIAEVKVMTEDLKQSIAVFRKENRIFS